MTIRRSVVISLLMLLLVPLLYFDGGFPFVAISELENPWRFLAAATPFSLAVFGSIVNWFEYHKGDED